MLSLVLNIIFNTFSSGHLYLAQRKFSCKNSSVKFDVFSGHDGPFFPPKLDA